MSSKTQPAGKILGRLKGLRTHMQAAEVPFFTVPTIGDGEKEKRNMPCDVVITNQRLFAYVYVSFPRERLFLDALSPPTIQAVSLRHHTYEPVFRELLVSGGGRKIHIRAPRQKIESLHPALRSAIEQYRPNARPAHDDEVTNNTQHPAPTYGRQEIRTSFERSPLAITLLFVGGLLLEIGGAVLWVATQSPQTGLPLFTAGLVSVITAFLVRRQKG